MFVTRLLIAVGVLAILGVLYYSRFWRGRQPPEGKPGEPPAPPPEPQPPPRYTVHERPRDTKASSNYEFDILEGDRVVARYWFDFRGDEHGVRFSDGREAWPGGRVDDFISGGGPYPPLLTPRAIAWLENELAHDR
ncbi:MAG TPA: hypothetical protein VFZ31_09040 [Vicinamibacterales bacterium]